MVASEHVNLVADEKWKWNRTASVFVSLNEMKWNEVFGVFMREGFVYFPFIWNENASDAVFYLQT